MIRTILKTILLAFIAMSATLLISCSDDEEAPAGDLSGNLIGSWTSTSVLIDEITVNGVDLVEYFTSLGLPPEFITLFEEGFAQGLEEDFDVEISFMEDGTYTTTDVDGTDSGVWELNANSTVLTLDKGTADEFEIEIVSLTDEQFVGKVSEVDESEDLDDDGTNDTLRISITLTLAKVN